MTLDPPLAFTRIDPLYRAPDPSRNQPLQAIHSIPVHRITASVVSRS
jgi:hypothetical protein